MNDSNHEAMADRSHLEQLMEEFLGKKVVHYLWKPSSVWYFNLMCFSGPAPDIFGSLEHGAKYIGSLEGNSSIFCCNAAWRVDNIVDKTVVSTCLDDSSNNGTVRQALELLLNLTITDAYLLPNRVDCCFLFDHRIRLQIFPGAPKEEKRHYDYGLWHSGKGIVIGPRSALRKSE